MRATLSYVVPYAAVPLGQAAQCSQCTHHHTTVVPLSLRLFCTINCLYLAEVRELLFRDVAEDAEVARPLDEPVDLRGSARLWRRRAERGDRRRVDLPPLAPRLDRREPLGGGRPRAPSTSDAAAAQILPARLFRPLKALPKSPCGIKPIELNSRIHHSSFNKQDLNVDASTYCKPQLVQCLGYRRFDSQTYPCRMAASGA